MMKPELQSSIAAKFGRKITEPELPDLLYQKRAKEIGDKMKKLAQEIRELEILEEKERKNKTFLAKIRGAAGSLLRRNLIRYALLPGGVGAGVALHYNSPGEYLDMIKNPVQTLEAAQTWQERHIEKAETGDPEVAGINTAYENPKVTRTTYDFLGEQKIPYKSGYYRTSVFDLSDDTPPKFEIINRGENYPDKESVLGITTNVFSRFITPAELMKKLKLSEDEEEMKKVPVIAYDKRVQTIRAGRLAEFDENWLVTPTVEIPLDFDLNQDGTVNLVYNPGVLRMVPKIRRADGKPEILAIGITHDRNVKRINPLEANRFGVLEGGKLIVVCGDRQLQVNGSFADIFRVTERLKKEYPGTPITAYLLDNGAYNLPIFYQDEKLTQKRIREHLSRHIIGGTALVLKDDGAIAPLKEKGRQGNAGI